MTIMGCDLGIAFYESTKLWFFWVDGVAHMSVCACGLLMNLFGIFILQKGKAKPLFTRLMIVLFTIDSFVLGTRMLCALFRNFKVQNSFLTCLYPYFIHPLTFVACSTSIWMTVVMSHERYLALHNPVVYRQAMGSAKSQKNQVLRYLTIVVSFSVAANVLKFFDTGTAMNGLTNSRISIHSVKCQQFAFR